MSQMTDGELQSWVECRVLKADDPLGEWVNTSDWCQLEIVRLLKCQRDEALAELRKIKGQSNFGLREAMEAEHWEPDDYGHEDKEAD